MPAIKLSDTVYSVGVQNPDLRIFDIVMRTEFGTTYNSFLIRREKTILVETSHHNKFEKYLDNIKEVCDPAEIDYIILNHTEPDHSGALAQLMECCPKAKILCSQAAAIYLKNITNCCCKQIQVVKNGDSLDIGGAELSFITAPFLHWPDSMFTYYPAESAVFTCDFLGSHYCCPDIMDSKIDSEENYKSACKNYYDAIFGPFPAYVRAGLEKFEALNASTAYTSHGPVLTTDHLLPYVLEQYKLWSAPKVHEKPLIPIFYVSAYGNTEALGRSIAEGIHSVLDADVPLYNIIEHPMEKLAAQLNESDAFLIGSPTLNKDAVAPVWQLLAHVDAINLAKRPCAVFGSFGWSGEAAANIEQRLSSLKAAVFENNYRIHFVPSKEELAGAVSFGAEFAASLKQ